MNKQKRVMIADDDPGILDAVEAMLEFGGYQVSSTPNGATLLDITDDFPDLLLLDIWMPGTDGRDVCKQLKAQESSRKMPIIMISASTELERSAKEAGADDFLEKPFDMDELLQKIEFYLNKNESN
ncbi:response regulator [Pedobacter sp.]|uniref:response regulator n=1 Tax=Pedobacter sp. TaxID=1411316 RepID=UPI003D7F1DDB